MSNITYKKTYWPNGKLQREIPYVNGEFHGLYRWWHENGQLGLEIHFVNEQQHGLKKWWSPSGELTDIDLYNNETLLMELKSTPIHSTKKIRLI